MPLSAKVEEKYTQGSFIEDVESEVLGFYLAGYCGSFGVRYDGTGWTDCDDNGMVQFQKNYYRQITGMPIHMKRMVLNGATIIDGPELVWQDDFRETGYNDGEGYRCRGWETKDIYYDSTLAFFRKVIDGSVKIPSRQEVIDRTQYVITHDVNSGNARSDIPQVACGSDVAGFHLDHCLMLNTSDADDIADMTAHLIEVHGFTEIDLLTGRDNMAVSHRRVEGYRRALESHRIAFDESRVMFGDFWMNSGAKLAESYISGERKMPQAVICANDYMAYGLLDTLADHGISVPESLTVVGYEFVRERHFHMPILTTYQRNREALGKIAVEMLLRKAKTGTYGSFVPPHGRVICGNSCTCGISLSDLNNE